MMKPSYAAVEHEVLELMGKLAGDWEYSGEITAKTNLFADLGFESLDLVILGTAIQERYGRSLPFAEFMIEIGQRAHQDVAIGELIQFVYQHLLVAPPAAAQIGAAR